MAIAGRLVERCSALQFVGSLQDSRIAHWDHEPGRDALPHVQADRQVGPTRFKGRRARPRSGLTTFREAKVSCWATNLWRAWEAKATSNKATGQNGRKPEGDRAFRLRLRCLLLADCSTTGGMLGWPVRLGSRLVCAKNPLAANATGFLFMTTQSPSAPQSQHGSQRSLPHRSWRYQL